MKSNIKHLTRKIIMRTRRNSSQDRFFKVKTDVTNEDTPNTQRGSNVLQENINTETVTSLAIIAACVTKNKSHTRRNLDHQRHTNWPVVEYLQKISQCTEIKVIVHQVKLNNLLTNEGTS